MKHYLLALAGLMAVSATATDRLSFREGLDLTAKSRTERTVSSVKTPVINSQNLQIKADKLSNTEIQNVKVAKVNPTNMVSTKTNASNITFRKIKSAADNTESDNSIAGSYTVTIGDYYFQSSVGAFTENATIEEADGQIVISCDYFPYDVVADYDAESGTITYNEVFAGTFDYYGTTFFINFEPFYWDDETEDIVGSSWTATFDASTGVISNDMDHGFSWIAYTDEALTDAYSYLDLFDVEGFTKDQIERQEIAGEYDIYIGDYYFQGGAGSFKDRATIEEEDGMIVISCEYFMTDVVADYNAATGAITFNSNDCGSTTTSAGTVYYVNFEPFYWDSETTDIVATSWTASFDPYTGTITTPSDHGLSWAAYEDADHTEFKGYFDIFDLEGLKKFVEIERSWVSVGEATFMDGWVLPVFGFDQTDPANWYKVPVEQDENNANVYRLVNPYQYGPVAEFNETTKPGYIEFDVTDPDHVVFAVTDAGFANSDLGVSQFYCINTLTWYCEYFSMAPSDIVSILGDETTYTTFKNGVVTLTTVEDEEDGGYINDACFGIQGNPAAGYGWINEDGMSLYMAAAIDLSETNGMTGAIKIENNSSAAPVRFYNLQGIEVANPAAGQVVIRVQGENAAKMIVR